MVLPAWVSLEMHSAICGGMIVRTFGQRYSLLKMLHRLRHSARLSVQPLRPISSSLLPLQPLLQKMDSNQDTNGRRCAEGVFGGPSWKAFCLSLILVGQLVGKNAPPWAGLLAEVSKQSPASDRARSSIATRCDSPLSAVGARQLKEAARKYWHYAIGEIAPNGWLLCAALTAICRTVWSATPPVCHESISHCFGADHVRTHSYVELPNSVTRTKGGESCSC